MVSINPSIYTLAGSAPMLKKAESSNPTASTQTSTSDVSTYTPSAPVTSDISGSPSVSAIPDNMESTSATKLKSLKDKVKKFDSIMTKIYQESTGYYMTPSEEQITLGIEIAKLAKEIIDKYSSKLSLKDKEFVNEIYDSFSSFIEED